ncbi:MAG: DNA repair protein [Nitrospirae bacterium]|nr:DNA repair protein [Nitrospirota bacterium]
MNDPRGSTWEKCDLHIHTPLSIVQHYGGNSEEIWEKFITDLENLQPEFKIIGINDYLFIDGYKKVLQYKQNGRLPKIELILPILEFRLKKFAGTENRLRKINFHVILSNELSAEVIEQQFLNALTSKYKLSPGLLGATWSGVITRESLEDLGRSIKSTVPIEKIHQYGSDLEEGFNNLTLDEDDILDVLNNSSYFNKKAKPLYLTAIGKTEWESLSWADGSIADKKDVINKANFVFISSVSIDQFHNAKSKLGEQNVNDLLLDCSDAKYYSSSSDKDRIGNCFTWIKADPTFEGLQYVLYEPESRIFVGDVPPVLKRVDSDKTKYINSISINKKEGSSYDEEIWFNDIRIELNPELVAIIGNKGNGKSALSDIIGLLGNSKNYKYFSFLNPNKFREPKNNKAKHFNADLEWASKDTDTQILSENPEDYEYEKVKYMPQKYLEILCNEEKPEFEKELKQVIFSHVPDDERLGMSSLDELINYQGEVINENVVLLIEDLNKINEDIVKVEDFLDENFSKTLAEEFKVKLKELDFHKKGKPIEVKKPETDESVTKEISNINNDLDKLSIEKKELEKQKLEKQNKKTDLKKKRAILDKILGELDNFQTQYDNLLIKIKNDVEELGLRLEEIISLSIKTKSLDTLKEEITREIQQIEESLNPQTPNNIFNRLLDTSKKIEELQTKLDEPNKKYQEYLKNLEEWQNKKAEMIGDDQKEGTIKHYIQAIKNIKSKYPKLLEDKRKERLEITKKIYRKKKELLEKYKSLYKPIETFATTYDIANYPVRFDVALEIRDFYDNFISHINQKVKGSFSGIDEGGKKIRSIIDETEFNNEEAVVNCLNRIIENLDYDTRFEKKEKRSIKQQIKKDVLDFYDYLFSLDYLVPKYTLRLGDVELSQLSPGEKGALLLIFYLLLDKNNIPLIMDQPEENLDNQSVYELLVKNIKEAKKKRQIIIVTHNPNLAVVCDAEQVIYAKIDKTNKNKVSYEAGSIENPFINKRIIDVLEGTMPAFSNRDLKYTITRKLMA